MRRPGSWGARLAAAAFAAALAAPALACPVCYGEASGGVIDGTKLSVAFLGGLVYLVLFGGVGMAVLVRRRAVRLSDPHHGLRLVTEGAADGAAERFDEGGGPDHGGGPDNSESGGRRPAEETSER